MENVSSYNIKIGTSADPKGVKDAITHLQSLGVTVEEVTKHGEKMGEGFGIAGHTAAHGIHLIGEAAAQVDPQLGAIGELARMARSPEFLVPAAALIAWKMLSDTMKEMVAQQQTIVEWNREVKRSHQEASEEAIRGIKAEMAAYDLSLRHQFAAENQLREALDERLKLFNSEVDHQMQLMGIESGRFEAYIKYLVSIGRMTGPQAESAINAHKLAQDDAKESADERKAQKAIDAKKQERDSDQASMAEQPEKLKTARAAVQEADAAARKKEADLKQEQDQYEKMDKTAKEAEERGQEWLLIKRTLQDPHAGYAQKAAAGADLVKMEAEDKLRGSTPQKDIDLAKSLRDAAETEKARIESMKNEKQALDDKLKSAQETLKEVEEEGKRFSKAIHDLTKEISDATLELAQKRDQYASSRAEAQRATQANTFYERVPQDRESAELFATAGGSTNATAAALRKVTTEATNQIRADRSHTANDAMVNSAIDHIVAIFASHANLTEQQGKKLLDLEANLNAIHMRLGHSQQGY